MIPYVLKVLQSMQCWYLNERLFQKMERASLRIFLLYPGQSHNTTEWCIMASSELSTVVIHKK